MIYHSWQTRYLTCTCINVARKLCTKWRISLRPIIAQKWHDSNDITHVRMPARTALLLCLILHTFSSFIECSIISQSSVTLCENDASEPSSPEGTTCSKKMLVTMGLKAGQKGSESLYANIDRVYQEGEEELSRLKNPFRIEIRKSEVTVTYPLYYKGVS